MKLTQLLLNKIWIISFLLLNQMACSFVPLGSSEYEPAKPIVNHIPKLDNGSIYQVGMSVGLFDGVTARRVGDIVTIVLKENTNASSSSNTNATKDQSVDLQSPTLAGQKVLVDGREVLLNEIEAGREFSGQGTSAKNSNLSGHITVTVAEVLTNGNLIIRGQKLMLLNQSEEFIRLTGIIRPQDILPDNTIDSYRVADVKVAFSGEGALASANNMGPLAKFFQSGLWPY
jgi:flagellar L-ring protein precursor FlgH